MHGQNGYWMNKGNMNEFPNNLQLQTQRKQRADNWIANRKERTIRFYSSQSHTHFCHQPKLLWIFFVVALNTIHVASQWGRMHHMTFGMLEGEPSGVCGMDFFLQQNLLVFHTNECSIHYTPLSPRHSNECTQKKEKTPRAKVIKIRLHRRGQNIQIDRMIEDVSARSYFSTTIKYHCEEKEKWLSQIQAN